MTAHANPSSRALTVRERRLVRGIAFGHSVAAAARAAGYSRGMVRSDVYAILRKAPLRAALARLLDLAGLTDPRLFGVLREGLDATETRLFTHEGRVVAKRTLPDYATRHRYLETALRLRGYLGREAVEEPEADRQGPIRLTLRWPATLAQREDGATP